MTYSHPNLDLSPYSKGSKSKFSTTPSPSIGKNPSIANMLAPSSSLGIQNPSQAYAASLAFANSKVIELSDCVFAPPKQKRRRSMGSRNRMSQKKMQEEDKPPTITHELVKMTSVATKGQKKKRGCPVGSRNPKEMPFRKIRLLPRSPSLKGKEVL
ncbi:hypothetical protein ACLB2K_006916 [Fragaria x ananassa]